MLVIENTLISDDLKKIQFVCDLHACRGACCVEGDAGAPLEEEEISVLEDLLEDIKPYMTEEGIKIVEKEGVFDYDASGAYVTPLVNGRECVFTVFDKENIAGCSIEKAFEAKAIDFQKPISCHLYPVRIKDLRGNEAINYHRWHICEKALANGKRLDRYLFEFLREPLIRKYGEVWYDELLRIIDDNIVS